jgi:hypothetical protein
MWRIFLLLVLVGEDALAAASSWESLRLDEHRTELNL